MRSRVAPSRVAHVSRSTAEMYSLFWREALRPEAAAVYKETAHCFFSFPTAPPFAARCRSGLL